MQRAKSAHDTTGGRWQVQPYGGYPPARNRVVAGFPRNAGISSVLVVIEIHELTKRYGVPARLLTAHGYGEMYPMHPHGTEAEMQQDRRVLVVRSN